MPVFVDNVAEEHGLYVEAERTLAQSEDLINVGLVNNMPDGALVSTERQLFDLLHAASDDLPIRLRFYALATVARSDWAREYVGRSYLGIDALCRGTLDGLIITGAEPKAPQLTEEPYWSELGHVFDWAKGGASSTICSCLAVHAAVRYLDGIDRRPLTGKCIGIFEQTRAATHALLDGAPRKLFTPHSRWNEIPEEPLRSHGYEVLTRSVESGVDTFIKQQARGLFVFLQGHPEYGPFSLLGEYRRDVGRFLRGEGDIYPTMPQHYFSEPTRRLLSGFQERATENRRPELLSSFPVAQASVGIEHRWREGAVHFYRNWLSYLRKRRCDVASSQKALP